MITSSYIFSETNSLYRQYPNPSNGLKVLKNLCKETPKGHQLFVHREDNLMYYVYTNKISDNDIYGLCITTSRLCTKLNTLFDDFTEIINDAAKKGVVFKYGNNGLIYVNQDYISQKGEVENLLSEMKNKLEQLHFETLQTQKLSISLNSTIRFSLEEDNSEDILNATRSYYNVYITFANIIPTSYSNSIKNLSYRLRTSQTNYDNLLKDYSALKKKQKQFTWVIVLSCLILLTIIFIIMLAAENNRKKDSLDFANDTIKKREETIQTLKDEKKELQILLDVEKDSRKKAEEKLEEITVNLAGSLPMVVTSTSFSFAKGYLTFTYYGLKDTTIDLTGKAVNGSVLYEQKKKSFSIHKGFNKDSIYITSNLNGSTWYSFELLKGYKILGGDMH